MEKQAAPNKSTDQQLSFEWPHFRIISTTQNYNHLVQHNKQHSRQALFNSFHLNGQTLGLYPQTQKLEARCLTLKGLTLRLIVSYQKLICLIVFNENALLKECGITSNLLLNTLKISLLKKIGDIAKQPGKTLKGFK